MNVLVPNPEKFSPLYERSGNSVQCQHRRVSLVSLLLFLGCPVAVAGFIIAVVISPFQAVFIAGARPHVGEECFETVLPTIAHFDPASPVGRESGIAGLIAPSSGIAPSEVFCGSGKTVVIGSSPNRIAMNTSTTSDLASNEMIDSDGFRFSTRAHAQGSLVPISRANGCGQNRETLENVANRDSAFGSHGFMVQDGDNRINVNWFGPEPVVEIEEAK